MRFDREWYALNSYLQAGEEGTPVDIFGRKRYQERIAELEKRLEEIAKENEELKLTLAKREERLRKITSAYQETRRALKDAEIRLSAQKEPTREEALTTTGIQRYTAREMKRLLRRLESIESQEDDILSEYLMPGEGFGGMESMQEAEIPRSIRASASERGMAILRMPDLFTLLIIPPIPFDAKSLTRARKFDLKPLRGILETPVLLVSAHAGDSMIMVALDAEHIEACDVVKTPVKEKHSKGGWSQRRFERLREEDIRRHGDELKERVERMVERYAPIIRYVALSGEAELVKQLNSSLRLPEIRVRMSKHDAKDPERTLDELYTHIICKLP